MRAISSERATSVITMSPGTEVGTFCGATDALGLRLTRRTFYFSLANGSLSRHIASSAQFTSRAYSMHWLQLTQAQTGATIYVNIKISVILIAPSKTGGTALVTSVREKESARIVPVLEDPQTIMAMLNGSSRDESSSGTGR